MVLKPGFAYRHARPFTLSQAAKGSTKRQPDCLRALYSRLVMPRSPVRQLQEHVSIPGTVQTQCFVQIHITRTNVDAR